MYSVSILNIYSLSLAISLFFFLYALSICWVSLKDVIGKEATLSGGIDI